MITHYIYEIANRKIGCCKNLKYRMQLYEQMEGRRPRFVRIWERLHDATDQEAGDREWWWADTLGYPRGPHYTIIINAMRIGGNHRMETRTPEQRSTHSRSAHQSFMKKTTPEQRSKWNRKAALHRWALWTIGHQLHEPNFCLCGCGQQIRLESTYARGHHPAQKDRARAVSLNTCWITNGVQNRRLKDEDLFPEGWRFGKTHKRSF
jgi:hypothetical protein